MSPNGSDRSPRRSMRRKLPQALAAGLVLATATGCSYEDFPRLGLPSPATEQGPIVISLWQGSWAAALATGVLVWGLIIWAVIFHRRSRTKVEVPPQTRYNMPIEALYTVVPLIIIAVLFYFTARDETDLLKTSSKPKHVVNVVGFQWSWGFNYLENVDGQPSTPAQPLTDNPDLSAIPTDLLERAPQSAEGVYNFGTPGKPPLLVLPEGETVQFILTSRDVIHSFWVPNFLFKLDVIPGHTNKFQIVANKKGTFRGKCAELCGEDHSRMLFNVKVVSPSDYRDYLNTLAKKGQTGYLNAGIAVTGDAKNARTQQSESEHK
ncbi:aa3-type cytochrome oxidase subunit II [Wenjunlia tyrosinilytica]|uniref:Probable cytochrome c oxidase subunit 2 n=1 Tax=Wenjunlia tyrosinilytica TaxID=1544741 RepID=A0A918E2P2_9ACTN|nr:cytochrome c oxidase subunit II [Wenjunlia tyrosinilytica]GGP00819.1 putative cytochrome c oxidase subunit 2 [Wenjunlia tyrosinilytica]